MGDENVENILNYRRD